MIMSYTRLLHIAAAYEKELTNFRLSGDIICLMPFLEAVAGTTGIILKDEFSNSLTPNERKAFIAIREEIGSAGNISIIKMSERHSLSRPVWNAVLQKMEKYGIARVKSQGSKGIHIEFVKEEARRAK